MHTASSAKRTCRLSLSAVEYTATVGIPISLHVRMMRNAISPLFAMSIFLNMFIRNMANGAENGHKRKLEK
jgi:hypothetical protein